MVVNWAETTVEMKANDLQKDPLRAVCSVGWKVHYLAGCWD